MTVQWWEGRMACLDLETTHPDPFEARIVTAAFTLVGGGEPTDSRTWLADPGIEIPAEATEVHGITTEHAREHGRPAGEVLAELLALLWEHCVKASLPFIVFNHRYDDTVMEFERDRHGLGFEPLYEWPILPVDPMVIDQALDRYRPSYPGKPRTMTNEEAKASGMISTRTLEGMCKAYGVTLDGAHDASFDAIAAGRLAYVMGKRGQVLRRRRDGEYWQVAKAWKRVRNDLPELVAWQRDLALVERGRFAEYKRTEAANLEATGSVALAEEARGVAERVELEKGWPVLEPIVCPECGEGFGDSYGPDWCKRHLAYGAR